MDSSLLRGAEEEKRTLSLATERVALLRPTTLEPGARLDRYELLYHLASGGMAHVWLARLHAKPEFMKVFAIKTILHDDVDNSLLHTMFLDEARLVSRIDHPNVVRVTDIGEHGGLPYLVMEFIEGESLVRIVRELTAQRRVMPLGIALRILADACNGLAAAHNLRDDNGTPLNVVHRDASPHNIIVTSSGVTKVIDFGIAKARDRVLNQTECGLLKGKATYMPVEQATGDEVDARTDLWTLGAVLYFLLTGRAPHQAETQVATLRRAMMADAIAPLPPTTPAPLRAFVARALAHAKSARFQTAGEMAAALEGVVRALDCRATHDDVAAFLESAMGPRLAAQRSMVAEALSISSARASARLAAAIPVDAESIFHDVPSGVSRRGELEDDPEIELVHQSGTRLVSYPDNASPARPRHAGRVTALGLLLLLVGAIVLFDSAWRRAAATAPPTVAPSVVAAPPVATSESNAAAAKPVEPPAGVDSPPAIKSATVGGTKPIPPAGARRNAVKTLGTHRSLDDEAGF